LASPWPAFGDGLEDRLRRPDDVTERELRVDLAGRRQRLREPAEQHRHRIMRTPARQRHLTQLGETDRGEIHMPAPGRVPRIAPPSRLPTAGSPLGRRSSAGSTTRITLPAIVCDSPLAFCLVASFRSNTERRARAKTERRHRRHTPREGPTAMLCCHAWRQPLKHVQTCSRRSRSRTCSASTSQPFTELSTEANWHTSG
jgi:hypothetical protein